MYRHIAKIVRNDQLGSNSGQCYIQNRVVMKHVIKRSRCMFIYQMSAKIQAGQLRSDDNFKFTKCYAVV